MLRDPCPDCGCRAEHYLDGGSCSKCDRCDFKKLENRQRVPTIRLEAGTGVTPIQRVDMPDGPLRIEVDVKDPGEHTIIPIANLRTTQVVRPRRVRDLIDG